MTQALTDWAGDAGSLIAEMKRRAAVDSDVELARFIGATQSTVSNWRQRGAVPESAVLRFERAMADPEGITFARSLAARTIALRLPEAWFQRLKASVPTAGRNVPYSAVAYSLNAVVAEIARQVERIERESGLSSRDLVPLLLEDEGFINGVIDWLGRTPIDEMLSREIEAAKRVR